MIQKIKNKLLIAATALMLFAPVIATTAIAGAANPRGGGGGGGSGSGSGASATAGNSCTGISSSLSEGANAAIPGGSGVDCTNTNVGDSDIKNLARKITNTFSIIVGAASVIMIIYGGFRYVTSGGESGRVGAAKNALLYAIVGLVIVALAQLIVHFVLSQTTDLGT